MTNREVRIFVDCTETVCSGINTGIQRTVRNIISRHALISKVHGISVIPVVAFNGRFYEYNAESDRKYFAPFLSKVFVSIRNILDKVCYAKKVKAGTLRSASCSDSACSRVGTGLKTNTSDTPDYNRFRLFIIELCRKILPFFFLYAFYLDNAIDGLKEADIGSDDIIFYPDAFCYRCTYLTFERYNSTKILLLYDIIPIAMPEACDFVYSNMFKRNLIEILNRIDGIISISNSELVNIKSFLASNGHAEFQLIDYFYLGADLVAVQTDPESIETCLVKAFSGQHTFVMVGTLEPRKNHAFVLDAFEQFWKQGGEASLCIIGKVSMLCSDLKSRIDRHEYNGSQLFCFQKVNDAGLAYSYEKCAGVIFASCAEGFGLPLVEAMWSGRPVLASDIPVFREIGAEYPVYFPLNDLDTLVQCLHDFTHGNIKKTQHKKWMSWDEAVTVLFEKILRMAGNSKQRLKIS